MTIQTKRYIKSQHYGIDERKKFGTMYIRSSLTSVIFYFPVLTTIFTNNHNEMRKPFPKVIFT